MRAANEAPSASVTILPTAEPRDIFRVRRAGYHTFPGGETRHGNETRLKTPSKKRQYGHSALPAGGPDGPEAA